MMKKLSTTVGSSLAVIAVLGVSGCSAPETSEAKTTVVDFVASDDPATYDDVIDAFEKDHTDIDVEYTQIPFDEYSSTIQQRIGAGDDTIDVYAVDQPRMAQLAAQGYLEDLSSLEEDARNAVSSAAYDTSVYDDTLWALPLTDSTQLLFYNKTLLDAAGIAHPSIDPAQRLTWEQIAADGAQAQQAGAKYGLLLEQPDAFYQVQPLIESDGGGSGITGADGLDVDITNDGWEKALTWYAGTFTSGLSERGIGVFEANAVFTDGNLAYFVGGQWDLAAFTDTDVDWGVAPMPSFADGDVATPTGSWSLGLNPASTDKTAAQEFMEYAALDTEGSYLTSASVGNLPANTEALGQLLPELEEQAGSAATGVGDLIAYESSTTATPRPVSVGYPQFEDAVNKAISDIRNGSDVAERLDQAQQEIEDAWAQLK